MLEALGDAIGGPSAFLMVLARSSGMVWGLAWLVGVAGSGLRARLAASAVIAVAVASMIGPEISPPADPLALGARAVFEVTAGAVLGLTAGLIAAAARLAGEIVGTQAGFSAASTLDPGAGEGPAPPLATFAGLVALATFVALDGPLRLLLALADSYRIGPAVGAAGGLVAPDGQTVIAAFRAVGRALLMALRLAMPAALALVIAQIAAGLLARTAPALANFASWLPARLAIGLLLTFLGVAGMASALASAWSATLPGG